MRPARRFAVFALGPSTEDAGMKVVTVTTVCVAFIWLALRASAEEVEWHAVTDVKQAQQFIHIPDPEPESPPVLPRKLPLSTLPEPLKPSAIEVGRSGDASMPQWRPSRLPSSAIILPTDDNP